MDVQPQPSIFQTQTNGLLRYLRRHQDGYIQPPKLYRHQVDAVLQLREYFNDADNTIALVVLPTGCGKTGVAVLASYALSAKRVLVITPSITISKQIREAYQSFLLNREIITPAGKSDVIPSISMIRSTDEIRHAFTSDVMITNIHKVGGNSAVQVSEFDPKNYDLVIVDEAHHYPARTWREFVQHFPDSKRLFLTATPLHQGVPILDAKFICYERSRTQAVNDGIIRSIDEIHELPNESDEDLKNIYRRVAAEMVRNLDIHDEQDRHVRHQGMVLAPTRDEARSFCEEYTAYVQGRGNQQGQCEVYIGGTEEAVLEQFVNGRIRTLVVVGRLMEGFDHKPVSVLGIVRRVAPTSTVLFAQFVGRAVRKVNNDDPIRVHIVTHQRFQQLDNFRAFEQIAEDDPDEDEDEIDVL